MEKIARNITKGKEILDGLKLKLTGQE